MYEMFLGHLKAQTKKTVGILDLGGGSTQITFLPQLRVSGSFLFVCMFGDFCTDYTVQ